MTTDPKYVPGGDAMHAADCPCKNCVPPSSGAAPNASGAPLTSGYMRPSGAACQHFYRTVERDGKWVTECEHCGFIAPDPAAPAPSVTGREALELLTNLRAMGVVTMSESALGLAVREHAEQVIYAYMLAFAKRLASSAPAPPRSVSEDFSNAFYVRSDHSYSGVQVHDWLQKWEARCAPAPLEVTPAVRLLRRLVAEKEPNGYPLWFNREVHKCVKCDPEDLCREHWEIAHRDFTGCTAQVDAFLVALANRTSAAAGKEGE